MRVRSEHARCHLARLMSSADRPPPGSAPAVSSGDTLTSSVQLAAAMTLQDSTDDQEPQTHIVQSKT